MQAETGPLIVAAVLGAEDFRWLDDLRRAHFPPERNRLPAHLTLFHHLPPSLAAELRGRLVEACRARAPFAEAIGPVDLGGGTAILISSPELASIRAELADAFTGLLAPQDQAGWRPHVTIQNKVPGPQARALQGQMAAEFWPRRLRIEGLACFTYHVGLWQPVSRHLFRG